MLGVHLAAIRSQKDKMSYWIGGREGGYAGGRGIQTFQVSQLSDRYRTVLSMLSDIETLSGYL